MSHGVVEQVGTPREVYDEPTTEFVADFLGISNIIAADAEPAPGGGARLRVGEFTLVAKAGETGSRGAVKCVVRPERVRLEPYDSGGENRVPAIVEQLVYLGSATRVVVHLATGQTLQSLIQSDAGPLPYEQGTAVQVYLPADAVRVLCPTGQGVTERSRALSVNRQMARRWSLAPYRSRRSKGPHSDQSTGGSSERPR